LGGDLDKSSWLILLVVGAVLFVVWRRTDVALANAQNRAAQISAGNSLVGQAATVAKTYWGL
jgi:hypothetical protein